MSAERETQKAGAVTARSSSLQRLVRRLVIWKFCLVNALLEWRLRALILGIGWKEWRRRASLWTNPPALRNLRQLYEMGAQVIEGWSARSAIQENGAFLQLALPDRRTAQCKAGQSGGGEQRPESALHREPHQ